MTAPDPAAELWEAADRLRKLAGAATPGPWREMHLGSEGCIVLRACATIRDRARVARFGWKEWKADHADAEYVASMHPLVALALADWLEAEADRAATGVWALHALSPGPLKVARTYLGTLPDDVESAVRAQLGET